MICKCIDDFKESLTVGESYVINKNGVYYGFTDDLGKQQYITKELFELYFEVMK
jgi:hypothetical protein